MRYWPNGLGGSGGDVFATSTPLYTSGDVWFVNSARGVDAASPAGKDRESPLATLGQAVANAASGDIVLLESGHSETISSTLTISKQLTISGGGVSGGVPGASITPQGTTFLTTLTLSAAGIEIRNVRFAAQPIAGAGNFKVSSTAASQRIIGCRFEMGANDTTGISLNSTSKYFRAENCTFISQGTSTLLRPSGGMAGNASADDAEIVNCVFDDGAYGFSSTATQSLGVSGLIRARIVNATFLNGADIGSAVAPTLSYVAGITQTGGGRVNF